MYTLIYILSDEEIMRNLIMLFASIFALYVLAIWFPAHCNESKEEEKNKSSANFSAKAPPDGYEIDFDEDFHKDFNEDFDEFDPDLTSYSQNYYTPMSTYNYNSDKKKNDDEFYKRMAFTMAYINNRERQKAKAEERNAKRYRNSKSYKNSKSSTSSRRNKKR